MCNEQKLHSADHACGSRLKLVPEGGGGVEKIKLHKVEAPVVKDPFETAENYNQFTRTYMFSVADSNVTSRIDAERSADDNITRDIMSSNREVCLINDWARIGEISEGTTLYNDFYIYHYESGELEQILTDGEVPDDTVYRGTISRNNEVILMDMIMPLV